MLTLLLGDLSDRAVVGASDRTYTRTMSGQYSGSWVRNTRADLDLSRNLAEGGVDVKKKLGEVLGREN